MCSITAAALCIFLTLKHTHHVKGSMQFMSEDNTLEGIREKASPGKLSSVHDNLDKAFGLLSRARTRTKDMLRLCWQFIQRPSNPSLSQAIMDLQVKASQMLQVLHQQDQRWEAATGTFKRILLQLETLSEQVMISDIDALEQATLHMVTDGRLLFREIEAVLTRAESQAAAPELDAAALSADADALAAAIAKITLDPAEEPPRSSMVEIFA
eukprot:gnl/TRDRNA2_/TRDRNA2_166855_c0_seq1.p1 gnl/TRDRNA2_/TRDRNA2_166855_c0~~gnl/TRDRNA2_/TRDRNA2_166855_c0_seq1.p1  ORF type:complete len:212 (-),score=37.02 gnl/TRDRNA2_/TRDRNA2_166855_c0_seq1:261-896(-)